MSFKKSVIAALFILRFLSAIPAKSQTDNDPVVDQIIESLSENAKEEADYPDLAERLNFYRKHPADINKISFQQLQELVFLSPVQINAFLLHREENGSLIHLLELQSIDGFDLETIRKLLNFISLNSANPFADISLKNLLKEGNNDLLLRYGQILQPQHGFEIPDSDGKLNYSGSPQRLFARYRYHYGDHISASLNMEKDAGEPFFSGVNSSGFDFYSANIAFKNLGKVSKLALGDYALQFGQGLTLWSGLGFGGKGADITTLVKQDTGLKPYTSVNESSFFRGLAATIALKNIAITPFVSYTHADGSFSTADTPSDNTEIKSLGISGLHRTQTEINQKNAIAQFSYGSNIKFHKRGLTLGLTAYHTRFNHAFEAGKQPYNRFEFAGKSLTNTGFNYGYAYKNTYFFGEAAHGIDRGFAFLNGLISSVTPQVSVALLYRNYQRNYTSFYNTALSEAGTAINEKGFYSGLTIKPNRKWEFSAYSDFFKFPWLKFGVDAPSQGYELFSQLTYTPNKKAKVIFRYKLDNKEENGQVGNAFNILEPLKHQNYRIELSYKINPDVTVRNRAEMAHYQKSADPAEFGFLIYQDLIYNPLQSKLSANIRFAIFDTEGFNSRIYSFENDVLYGYAIQAYQNRGSRVYLNGRYTFKRGLDLWLKYSLICYTNRQTIGSGLDQINGSKRSDIKLQMRYQF